MVDKIKLRTGFTWEEIVNMSDKEYFTNITKLAILGKISWKENTILDEKRHKTGLDEVTLEALKIFGGKVLNDSTRSTGLLGVASIP